jgi:hypothetical protein
MESKSKKTWATDIFDSEAELLFAELGPGATVAALSNEKAVGELMFVPDSEGEKGVLRDVPPPPPGPLPPPPPDVLTEVPPAPTFDADDGVIARDRGDEVPGCA